MEIKGMASRVFIHVHVFYPELWPELRTCIVNFRDVCGDGNVSTYVTYPVIKPEIGTIFKEDPLVTQVIAVENYGYDVAPFFRVLDQVALDDFDFVVKLHTKRNTPLCWVNFSSFEGAQWRRSLLSFCSSKERVRDALRSFARSPKLGMIAARPLIDPSGLGAGRHPELAAGIVESLGCPAKGRTIVYGTMFMIRANLLKPAWQKVNQLDFGMIIPGREHEEFGLAGLWEGAFGMLVNAQGCYVSDGIFPGWMDRLLLMLRGWRFRILRLVSDGLRERLGLGFTYVVLMKRVFEKISFTSFCRGRSQP